MLLTPHLHCSCTAGKVVLDCFHTPVPCSGQVPIACLFQVFAQSVLLYCHIAGKLALEYFHTQCPCLAGLKEGENEAEWLVDLTTQVGSAPAKRY